MPYHLFIFGFETPDMVIHNRAFNDDFEVSEAVFISADSQADAINWGRQLANSFLQSLFGDSTTIDNWAHWVSDNPQSQYESHILDQLPRIESGNLDQLENLRDSWLTHYRSG